VSLFPVLAGLLGALLSGPVRPDPIASAPGPWDSARRHDLHLTHTRMVIEGRTVACRIRLFKDDLQAALRQYADRPDLALTHEARADSLFQAYWTRNMRLDANGVPLALRVTSSGAETDPAAQEVVWYVLEGTAGADVARLTVLNALMFELFRDQQNIIQLLRLPGDTRKTLYFAATDPREQTLELRD